MDDLLPRLRTEVPGPTSRSYIDTLARHECPAITARRARRAAALGVADDDPFVWESAEGAVITDVDGNRFVDFTAGFGVALLGHRPRSVVAAAAAQSQRLLHAMGDAFPDVARIDLLERLARVAPEGLDVAILGLSGSDAIEAAVKTAVVATGRDGVLTFGGGYHGLSIGAVGLQSYHPGFAAPFRGIHHPQVTVLPWACPATQVEDALQSGTIGLVLVEPVQGRGGMRAPPDGWLDEVGAIARRHGALVAHDEILTGLGRTGELWAGRSAIPDLLCTGKALGGGFPLSACLGTRAAMDAWGASTGQAIHTQTFLGHPLACATALAVLDEVVHTDIPGQAARASAHLRAGFASRGFETRGRGLVLGVVVERSLAVSRALLRRGWLALPAGVHGEVLGLTPPATLADAQMDGFLDAFDAAVREVA